jgi:hypothetical protein
MATTKNQGPALNMDKIRERFGALQNQGNRSGNNNGPSQTLWRPQAEKGEKTSYTIRFVPTADGDPFKDLHFHYGVNNKSILCPKNNYGEKCAICEFASGLWFKGKDNDDEAMKKQAKELFVKQRFFAPVILRGDEAFYEEGGQQVEFGVRWYGFGRQTYQALLELVMNPDYGDITHVEDGVDFDLIYDRSTGKSFPETKLIPKRKSSPLYDNSKKIVEVLKTIPDIGELYKRMSPEEVESELQQFLNVTDGDGEGVEHVAGTEESDLDSAIASLRA